MLPKLFHCYRPQQTATILPHRHSHPSLELLPADPRGPECVSPTLPTQTCKSEVLTQTGPGRWDSLPTTGSKCWAVLSASHNHSSLEFVGNDIEMKDVTQCLQVHVVLLAAVTLPRAHAILWQEWRSPSGHCCHRPRSTYRGWTTGGTMAMPAPWPHGPGESLASWEMGQHIRRCEKWTILGVGFNQWWLELGRRQLVNPYPGSVLPCGPTESSQTPVRQVQDCDNAASCGQAAPCICFLSFWLASHLYLFFLPQDWILNEESADKMLACSFVCQEHYARTGGESWGGGEAQLDPLPCFDPGSTAFWVFSGPERNLFLNPLCWLPHV